MPLAALLLEELGLVPDLIHSRPTSARTSSTREIVGWSCAIRKASSCVHISTLPQRISEFKHHSFTMSHAPPALITPFAIGIESMRFPSGPLSEPPFGWPGTLNWTTQSLYLAPAGESISVL